MNVGENIKRIRTERGLTQKQLGDLCGMADSAIRRYELGKANPKMETLYKIATGLGVSIILLVKGCENKYPLTKEEYETAMWNAIINKANNATVTTRTVYVDVEKEDKIVDLFEMLNDAGQDKAIEHTEMLTKIPEYQKEPPSE